MNAGSIAEFGHGGAHAAQPGPLAGENKQMTDISHAEAPRSRVRRGERWEFHALVALTYPLFLVATLVERAVGGGRNPKRSVFAEAHAAAAASLACAFMG